MLKENVMYLWFGGKYAFSEPEKPKHKESEPEKAARKCARTGNHKDLQRYLKLRRMHR